MQDIAGCRAIVRDLDELQLLWSKLKKSRSVHKIIRERDYLTTKPSGYGGVHLIYECYNSLDSNHEWKGAKVEVQLRTELQHAWATSLEIIDTLEQTCLKTGYSGQEKWRRFFSLAGKLVANFEKACTLPETALVKIRHEVWKLYADLQVNSKLSRYTMAIKFTTSAELQDHIPVNAQGMLLLLMRRGAYRQGDNGTVSVDLEVDYFSPRRSQQALDALNAADLRDDLFLSVLLSVADVKTLKQAYPNYFGSTNRFSKFIESEISQAKKNVDTLRLQMEADGFYKVNKNTSEKELNEQIYRYIMLDA